MRSGRGTLSWQDGDFYIGDFIDNKVVIPAYERMQTYYATEFDSEKKEFGPGDSLNVIARSNRKRRLLISMANDQQRWINNDWAVKAAEVRLDFNLLSFEFLSGWCHCRGTC
jgi:hypothetical protein